MAKPLQLTIRESLPGLKQILREHPLHLRPRIQMLILIKQEKALSKRGLADALGVNPNSVQTWRSAYRKGGLSALVKFNRGGYKPSVFTPKAHQAIERRLTNPQEAFSSYVELWQWVKSEFFPALKYVTLNAYVKRQFGAKLKVARKSHVRKDPLAIESFKKKRRS